MNIKNIRGHLPDLSYKDTEVLYFLVCHTVTFSWKQSQNPLPGHKNIQISKKIIISKSLATMNAMSPTVFALL